MSVWNLFAPFSDQNESCQSGNQSLFRIRTHHFSLEINAFFGIRTRHVSLEINPCLDQSTSCQPGIIFGIRTHHFSLESNPFLGLELIISVWKSMPFLGLERIMSVQKSILVWIRAHHASLELFFGIRTHHFSLEINPFLGLELCEYEKPPS